MVHKVNLKSYPPLQDAGNAPNEEKINYIFVERIDVCPVILIYAIKFSPETCFLARCRINQLKYGKTNQIQSFHTSEATIWVISSAK